MSSEDREYIVFLVLWALDAVALAFLAYMAIVGGGWTIHSF